MTLCCLHDGFNGTVRPETFSSVPGEHFVGSSAVSKSLRRRKVFWASSWPAAVRLSGISACLQRLTVRVTWRTHAERELDDVGAGERAFGCSCGRTRRLTVRISSSRRRACCPRRRVCRLACLQTPGQVAHQPFAALSADRPWSQACRSAFYDARMQMQAGRRLDDVTALVDLAAMDGGGHTEGICRIALLSAFTQPTMNSRGSVG